jgi:hypothetical protein
MILFMFFLFNYIKPIICHSVSFLVLIYLIVFNCIILSASRPPGAKNKGVSRTRTVHSIGSGRSIILSIASRTQFVSAM